jgi:hypothetical protein
MMLRNITITGHFREVAVRYAASILILGSLLAGCQTPCGPLWGLGGPSPAPGSTTASPASPTAAPGTTSPTPRPSAAVPGTASPVPSTAPTTPAPVATASPAGNDVSTAIMGKWFYSDLKSSSTLEFEADGQIDTWVSNDPSTIAMYRFGRYTVDGDLVQLFIDDAPGFEGGSATVSISADGQRMTTKGGKVYKRK